MPEIYLIYYEATKRDHTWIGATVGAPKSFPENLIVSTSQIVIYNKGKHIDEGLTWFIVWWFLLSSLKVVRNNCAF